MSKSIQQIGQIVNEFYQSLPAKDYQFLASLYQSLVKARNQLAVEQQFPNYLDMQIQKVHKIPESSWQIYLSSRDNLVGKFCPNVDSKANYPHFLSKLEKLNLEFPEDVYKLHPKFSDMRNKIDLTVNGGTSHFQYDETLDRYSVTIADANHNQQVAMLIHELSHVVDQEQSNHKVESVYQSELGAHQIEFAVAKNISPEFYRADIQEYLSCFVRTDFEQQMFADPEQDPAVLFAKTLKKYYGDFPEEQSYLFLFDDKIIRQPFSDLSTSVSISLLLE